MYYFTSVVHCIKWEFYRLVEWTSWAKMIIVEALFYIQVVINGKTVENFGEG